MSRRNTYYWKCDRPAAFFGIENQAPSDDSLEPLLSESLTSHFRASVVLKRTKSQGNHLTWLADIGGKQMFIRVENGPERDNYIEMESTVMKLTKATGLPLPEVFATDASRSTAPFAWQAIEYIDCPDLNHFFKAGTLNTPAIARTIGISIARWQSIKPMGFGPFDNGIWKQKNVLQGFHAQYSDYFFLRLNEHLEFLARREFLTFAEADAIHSVLCEYTSLLELSSGCLVHKDLALWNILGSETRVRAFIDFDDAISGDPMDDLSLLACFHDASFLQSAMEGYDSILPSPSEYRRRFWMHLIRNMIVKSVIRVGAGYFKRGADFFLITNNGSGESLAEFTRSRLFRALEGLRTNAELSSL
jgi:fructosamine-3-kinase